MVFQDFLFFMYFRECLLKLIIPVIRDILFELFPHGVFLRLDLGVDDEHVGPFNKFFYFCSSLSFFFKFVLF